MAMFYHTLRLEHVRRDDALVIGEHDVSSRVEVEASSTDLIETWREVFSRLPNDVYAAAREAMKPAVS